jgi:hypothetical protein
MSQLRNFIELPETNEDGVVACFVSAIDESVDRFSHIPRQDGKNSLEPNHGNIPSSEQTVPIDGAKSEVIGHALRQNNGGAGTRKAPDSCPSVMVDCLGSVNQHPYGENSVEAESLESSSSRFRTKRMWRAAMPAS